MAFLFSKPRLAEDSDPYHSYQLLSHVFNHTLQLIPSVFGLDRLLLLLCPIWQSVSEYIIPRWESSRCDDSRRVQRRNSFGEEANPARKLFRPCTGRGCRSATSTTLPKPSIENIDNFASTQLMVKLTTIPNARAYEVRINPGDDKWQNAGVFTKSRRVLLDNLTPGSTYTIQARAVGGRTGYSDWSDPVSHMSL